MTVTRSSAGRRTSRNFSLGPSVASNVTARVLIVARLWVSTCSMTFGEARPMRIAHERDDLVAAGEQLPDDRATDEPPAAGDRDAHQ